MDVKDAINGRKAIRGFLDKPVPREILQEVLQLAARAVSAVNAQPWEIAVITGETLKFIRNDNMDSVNSGGPEDNPFPGVSGIYRQRSIQVAKQLFSAMDIARDDKEKRTWWGSRGYRFFDAPVGIVLYMDKELDSECFRFDMGCIAQNICIAAMEFDLGTCVAYQPIEYERGLRKYLKIPDNKKLICGIAIGYPDWEFSANQVISMRESVDDIVKWYGYH
ncbi:nitroreductase [uncultured Clostridium sp.]|uniref:nitroreductase n=1 Tax=uncultured Clostridium sp. TaxID=59620 RepID=UPI0025E1E01C|nr:nitroreductase [uncultured Clostridium sp.]